MPLDAVFLTHTAAELREELLGARIDKIHQPAKDAVILQLRSKNGNTRLLLSANPGHPRAHLTRFPQENPQSPPMFCMLLRKHLSGGRLTEILQPPMERVLDFQFLCNDEFGEEVSRHLIIEIMGRNSNLVLTGADGRIIDCVRRVDYEMSQARQVLPGLFYHLPPAQNKRNPASVTLEELSELLVGVEDPVRPDSFLMDHFSGIPPLVARELVYRFDPDVDDLNALPLSTRYAFGAHLHQMFSRMTGEEGRPYLLLKNGAPWDFCYMPVTQYGAMVECRAMESYSSLLDSFYAERDAAARMRSKSSAIVKTVTNLRNRAARKLENQRKELAATADRDILRIRGELITANLYRIERGQTKLVAENYYDPELKTLEIPLSPMLSPQQNAAKYFKDYNKAKNAEKYLTEQIRLGTQELDYLESVLETLNRAETEKDITEIRAELVSGGYIRNTDKKKRMKTQPSRPLEFVSSDGFRIRVGRNNTQNDQLTLRSSMKNDIWLHTQKIHGSHVIISCEGREPSVTAIEEAAKLAAYYSQARAGQNVPVDYALVKYVKKPAGAKPGMVIYDKYNTAYVTPDPLLPERLRANQVV